MTTEIYVGGKPLDVSADISSLLTFAIDDIRDFASRQTTFSKTITLPGTANNNAIFGNIFDTGISNDYNPYLPNIGLNFNASKSAACIIFQDNFQTFKGTLRLLEIDLDNGRYEYQAALNGDLTTLNVSLTNGLLSDLDFSAYNRPWTYDNIVSSWDNAPASGVYFPMADYGTYSALKHDWSFRTFRPALYVKEYIDKIFAAAGFRYECNLFNSDRFKRLIIPHNQKDVNAPRTGAVFNANTTSSEHLIDKSAGITSNDATFQAFVGGLFTTTDNKTFTYNGTGSLTCTLLVNLNGTYNFGSPTTCKITVQVNGVDFYNDNQPLLFQGAGNFPYTKNWSVPLTLSQGDAFAIHYELGSASGFLNKTVELSSGTLSVSTQATVSAPVEYGEQIQFQYIMPQNIRQLDFLASIVKMFNLYIYEDQYDNRLIHISPFIFFYQQGQGSILDWTHKLDHSQPIKIKPMSEVNSKIYNFNFTSDGDYYNDLYRKRYNQVYGSFIFDSQFEFATETNTLSVIFAPTPLVGYVNEDKVYPTIFKRTGNVQGQGEETIDSIIRILQTLKIDGVNSWDITNGSTVLGSQTAYGYAGHYDDPRNPGNDLNFGGLNEVFFLLQNGQLDMTQFNVYWSGYMAEITNKDSKLLTAKFYLTPADIFNLDFAKFVSIGGVLFRLNKITDYNATLPSTCEVELLNVINLAYSYPPGSVPMEDYTLEWSIGQPMWYGPPSSVPVINPGNTSPILYK